MYLHLSAYVGSEYVNHVVNAELLQADAVHKADRTLKLIRPFLINCCKSHAARVEQRVKLVASQQVCQFFPNNLPF